MERKKEITEQGAFSKLAALCARSEHCQHDLTEKMRQWGMDEQAQARVMERLVKGRYVDEERFVRAFVDDKIRYNHWGRRKVEQALWMKQVDRDLVAEVLDEVESEAYVEQLRPLLQQKRKSVTGRNDYERNMKLLKWAVGRGFTMDVIRQCMTVEDDDFSD